MPSAILRWAGLLGLLLAAGVAHADGLPKAPPDPPDVQVPGIDPRTTDRLVTWIIGESGRLEQPACWRVTRGNGAGRPLRKCPKTQQNQAGMCFDRCPDGYEGVGPTCLKRCPDGYAVAGPTCLRPAGYRRPAYPWKLGDPAFNVRPAKKRCKRAHGDCQREGDVFYPRCKPGFRGEGDRCNPRCPDGFAQVGAACSRPTQGRAVQALARCRPGEVERLGRCFRPCPGGWTHDGPVCTKGCGPGHPVECGGMCAHSTRKCVGEVAKMVLASAEVVANIAGLALTGGSANVAIKAATTAAKAGSKVAAKIALKTAVRIAAQKIAGKLTKRVGAQVGAFVLRKSGRPGAKALAKAYTRSVVRKAAKKIALARASQIPELREIVALIDPTGVASVINAFDKPKCVPKPMPR